MKIKFLFLESAAKLKNKGNLDPSPEGDSFDPRSFLGDKNTKTPKKAKTKEAGFTSFFKFLTFEVLGALDALPFESLRTLSLSKRVVKNMFCYSLLVFFLVPVFGAAQSPAIPTPLSTVGEDGGIITPLATSEEDFYRRAFPIGKTHSFWALILIGTVLIIIFALLIRSMARSGPRKIPPQ